MNVVLHPFTGADAIWLDTWISPVARSVGYDALGHADAGQALLARLRTEKTLRARVIERDGDAVGVILYRLHAPKRGAAIIELVATPPSAARLGTGMTAAALAEDELRAEKVRRVYAPAPAVHGISMYFWIRLGYRPLLSPEWPCRLEGVAWLVRDL
ncbi:MAG: GNAT family N-acetyltransferase [Chloroflexota bacterium]|nr:GNAT family N-acetyltransferase [Chloroflexota bacterium]